MPLWRWAKSNGFSLKRLLDEPNLGGGFECWATLILEPPKLGIGPSSQSGLQDRALVIQGLLTQLSEQGLINSMAYTPPCDVRVKTKCNFIHVNIPAKHGKLLYRLLRSQEIGRAMRYSTPIT